MKMVLENIVTGHENSSRVRARGRSRSSSKAVNLFRNVPTEHTTELWIFKRKHIVDSTNDTIDHYTAEGTKQGDPNKYLNGRVSFGRLGVLVVDRCRMIERERFGEQKSKIFEEDTRARADLTKARERDRDSIRYKSSGKASLTKSTLRNQNYSEKGGGNRCLASYRKGSRNALRWLPV
ncbi:hypothetical protein HZH66_010862 [Vespula vulgaris]|uniref:Uncharacterized protein n=1 Tax=Vespula vulgaris TaxID=7454 RepID=A0A834MWR1_VESVU|nr:hypothetical protein HZH66_010862 [Vespula vulgaris]